MPSRPRSWSSIHKILKVFNEAPDKGFQHKLSRDETTVEAFLMRADAILDSFGTASVSNANVRNLYSNLADPSKSVQPSDVLCRIR